MKRFFPSLLAICLCIAAFGQMQLKNDTPSPYPCDEFEYVTVYSITHGSVVIRTSSHTIFIDPVLNMGGKQTPYDWFKPCQGTVLLTHEHGDHLSKEAIDNLSSNNNRLDVFGNRKSIDALGGGTVLNNGDAVSVDNGRINIKAVPAYNTTKGHTNFHPKGNGNGYLIEVGDLVIYVAGDTEVIPEMKEFGKVDIAVLPVNQPYTMTPEQCIEAAGIIKPRVLIPYHMGDTDMSPVVKAFDKTDIQVIFHEELR